MVDIFIGGAGDHSIGNAVTSYVDYYKKKRPNAKYFTWKPEEDIYKLIDGLKTDEAINFIGHSYGGDTAATIATHYSRRINLLITVDPVSQIQPSFPLVKANVKFWVNVHASSNADISISDFLSFMGGDWGDDPKKYANIYFETPFVHASFFQMMNWPSPDGRTCEQILLQNSAE